MFGTGNQASTFGESGNAPDRNDLYAAMGVALASLAFHLLYEPIALGSVEPLDGSCYSFRHVPTFLRFC